MRQLHATTAPGTGPVRLFDSDALEFFTHVHPAVVPIVWVPVAAAFLVPGIGLARASGHPYAVLPAVACGVILWTAAEYLLHRFIFHFRPRTPLQERISFLMHGVHHAQPRVKTRLVMPLMVSVPLTMS